MKNLIASLLLGCSVSASFSKDLGPVVPVALPGVAGGVGFDDLGFAGGLKRVLAPGGRTGKIFLVDPVTHEATSLSGFTAAKSYSGGHDDGVTTADEGGGLVFGADHNMRTVVALDPKTGAVVASEKLKGSPDYVRWAASAGEVWVSEPDSEKIEVFKLLVGRETTTIRKAGEIAVPGGPEFLIIDDKRGQAYTNTWKEQTFSIGLKSRAIEGRWKNGCAGSRGLALDAERGFLFVGCAEGKGVALDAAHGGKVLSTVEAGSGVDVIGYSAVLRHLYLPGSKSATMTVAAVSNEGALKLLGTLPTAKGAHCAVADESGGAWVCDPDHGRLLYFKDSAGSGH